MYEHRFMRTKATASLSSEAALPRAHMRPAPLNRTNSVTPPSSTYKKVSYVTESIPASPKVSMGARRHG